MQLPSGLSLSIESGETIARFIRQSNYVAQSTGRIKHSAFLPAPDNDTSTFRVRDLSEQDIRELAVEHVQERAKNGAAIFSASVVAVAKLYIEAKEPPNRHANIRGWSMSDDRELRKSERKTAAMALAEESKWMHWA